MCIGMANGGKQPKELTDKEIVKEKIKAIYPHIVVGGDIDKPCYTIHWYDIEQKTMIYGFGSYKLELVRKWLEEEFEVVERDIDDLLNRQQAQLEYLQGEREVLLEDIQAYSNQVIEQQAEIEKLTINMNAFGLGMKREKERADTIRAEAIKEFANKLKTKMQNEIADNKKRREKYERATYKGANQFCADSVYHLDIENTNFEMLIDWVDNLVKEMVGEGK